jgi:hypothetical protein
MSKQGSSLVLGAAGHERHRDRFEACEAGEA